MKYLLDEGEYKELLNMGRERSKELDKKVQELCTMVADHVPVVRSWEKDKPLRPWGCILSEANSCGYCDECPASKLCPYPSKEFSQ